MSLVPRNKTIVNRVQRKALLRGICSYRTVSYTATNILSGSPPADLLAEERKAMFSEKRSASRCQLSPRAATMRKWKARIAEAKTGGWSKRLISDVDLWCGKKGDLDFHTTQILSGHGCFRVYLHRIKKEESDMFHHCNMSPDSAEHTVVECPAWDEERLLLEHATGKLVTVDNLVAHHAGLPRELAGRQRLRQSGDDKNRR
ncbi:uncharacterized protein LOC113560175 [Rhopalosiphum maidis]|uniref:uncharacterized protein LOC113560153 n=1 Tax=Rhopalosiphum maidis TaxID=43146 RepID=UPI000EFE192A|nr:uncharacterized protein LOC113560153 [Rhopalosiphum maidis]XP_026821734.1 uncharacterized protein LOC113560175 [Rhopalosiphum maidis]